MKKLPLALLVTAIYFTLIGASGLVWPLLDLGPHHPDFAVKSIAFRLGAYSRELTLNALFLVTGIGIFRLHLWARKLGLVLLVVSTLYSGYAFAWGFAHGRPSWPVILFSLAVAGLWNAIWFYLLYRRSSVDALRGKP